ncbi:PREDICTED: homeobox protein 2-like [Polistes canadensis]|uniref:homeobox protein 2-like n=1 Tax=Polistes canadensis TaxID=91411 RepID=UPI00071905D8|nr:PREDICTED: homeobox protein 2-like [Polistes canadensis]
MHYSLHILLCYITLWNLSSIGSAAKSTINSDILTTFAKNVASALTPTLFGDFPANRANRSFFEISSVTKTEEIPRLFQSTKDKIDQPATTEIYREESNANKPNRLSNVRRQADDFYSPYERPNYPDNVGYRQSQFYDSYNGPNNYFQPIGRDDRTNLRGSLNLGRPVNTRNFVNNENIESPDRFDSIYRSHEQISNDRNLGRPFNGFNEFNGYSSFEDRRRGNLRYHHSPLPIDGHYFGPFGFGPHVPYHHPLGYKYPYGYHGRRPTTESNNSSENNNSKEETKEENGSDRPKSDDRRPIYGGYKPFYDFPPPYKFGPGYYHHRDYNESSVDHRHYHDPYYHKYYDYPYYDDFYPGPYGYGPKPKNGNKNNGNNNGGGNSETQVNKDAETISASEKAEKTIDASNLEYKIKIPTTPFEDGLENKRIVDDEVDHIDPNA